MRVAHQKGLGLIEIILILAVVSLLLLAALFSYPQVRLSNQANTERQRLLRMISVIRPIFISNSTYAGLTTDGANAAGAFEPEANSGNRAAGQAIRNVWDGSVTVSPAANPIFMQITYTNVPEQACSKLITGVSRNFASVLVDGVEVWRYGLADDFDISAAITACAANPAGATMQFIAE